MFCIDLKFYSNQNYHFTNKIPCVMGLFSKLAFFLGVRKKEVNVLVVGLNNSGKSTVVNHFKNEEEKVTDVVPTVGFSVEKFQSR